MTRLIAQEKEGFYPTPATMLPLIARLCRSAPAGTRGLDPCAGEGTAFRFLADAWGLEAYGVELNEERGALAREALDRALVLDFNDVTATKFSLVYNNPPYEVTESEARRQEYWFVRRGSDALIPGGVHLVVLPDYRVTATPQIARFFTAHHSEVRAWRFPEPEYNNYRQIVLVGVRRSMPVADEAAALKLLTQIRKGLPTLEEVEEPVYSIPVSPAGFTFRGKELDIEKALAEARTRSWLGTGLEVAPENCGDILHSGARATVDAYALAGGRLVLLSMVGRRTHLRAIKAVLDQEKPVWLDGQEFLRGGTKIILTRATLADEAADHWLLLHPRATLDGIRDSEAGPFYCFGTGEKPEKDFLRKLTRAVFVPAHPQWNEALWHLGLETGLVSELKGEEHAGGCRLWSVSDDAGKWSKVVADGILAGRLPTCGLAGAAGSLRPAMPFKRGHIAMTLATGLLDNLLLERGEERWLLRGRIHQFTETVKQGEDVEVERTRYEPQLILVNLATGEIKLLTQATEQLALVEEWSEEIARSVLAGFTPRYLFNFRETLPAQAVSLLDGVLAVGRKLPGRSETGLLEGQKHIAAAVHAVLKEHRHAAIVMEMGGGKSVTAVATAGLEELDGPGGFPCLTLCPEVMPEKWVKEWQETWPLTRAVILRTVRDVDEFARRAAEEPRWKWVAIITNSRAKLADGWMIAVQPARVRIQETLNGQATVRTVDTFRCPTCGAPVMDEEKDESGHARKVLVTDQAWLEKRTRFCGECGGALWEMSREVTARIGRGQEGFGWLESVAEAVRAGVEWTAPRESRPPPVRYPLAAYIAKRHPRLFKFFVADEAHRYKGKSSDQGHAFGALSRVIPKTLLLTGTIFGGTASSLFYLLFRVSPPIRRMFAYDEEQRWSERYGVIERLYKLEGNGHTDVSGKLSGRRRRQLRVRELPGISQELITLLLETTVFVRLQDLGHDLPPYAEKPILVDLDPEHARAYSRFESACRAALVEDHKLAGSYVQNLLGYSTAPFREHHLTDVEGSVFASAPDLEVVCGHCGRPLAGEKCCVGPKNPKAIKQVRPGDTDLKGSRWQALRTDGKTPRAGQPGGHCHSPEESLPAECKRNGCGVKELRHFAPEAQLLETLQSHLATGDRVIVYVRQTRTRDIVPRLLEICSSAGINALRLQDTSAEARDAWLRKLDVSGVQVLFANPQAVEVGLDLVQFNVAVFYELVYSLFTLWQAARRVWRLGQERPVTVYYLSARSTLSEQALALMVRKLTAALSLYGDAAETELVQAGNNGSFVEELAKAVLAREDIATLDQLFARHNVLLANRGGAKYLLPGQTLPGAPLLMKGPPSLPSRPPVLAGTQLSLLRG